MYVCGSQQAEAGILAASKRQHQPPIGMRLGHGPSAAPHRPPLLPPAPLPACLPCPPLQQLGALHIFQGHLGVVEDVAWHPRHADLFGSVGDDKKLIVWDLRKPHNAAQDKVVEAHTGGCGGGLWRAGA